MLGEEEAILYENEQKCWMFYSNDPRADAAKSLLSLVRQNKATFGFRQFDDVSRDAIWMRRLRQSDLHSAKLVASYNQLVENDSFIGTLTGRDKSLQGMQDLVEQAAKSLAAAGIATGTKAAIALVF